MVPFKTCHQCNLLVQSAIQRHDLHDPSRYNLWYGDFRSESFYPTWKDLLKQKDSCVLCNFTIRRLRGNEKQFGFSWHPIKPSHIVYATIRPFQKADEAVESKKTISLQPNAEMEISTGAKGSARLACHFGIAAEYNNGLDMTALPGSADNGTILYRNIPPSPRDGASLSLASHWIRNCKDKHLKCGRSGDGRLPKRVIDLTLSTKGLVLLTVVDETQLNDQYATLTYRHDPRQRIRSSTVQANCSARYDEGILVSDLPQTFQDAITVCHRLGVQYLWIDAICVIQDDPYDKNGEFERRGEIFSNSLFTIYAHRANNCEESFLKAYERQSLPLPSGDLLPTAVVALETGAGYGKDDIFEREALNRDGWSFEERFFSSRGLHFGEHQLMWQCRAECRFEDGSTWFPEPTTKNISFNESRDDKPSSQLTSTNSWYQFVEQYSKQEIPQPSDRIMAVGSIAKVFENKCGGYVAGLWEGDMERGLLWSRLDLSRKSRRINGGMGYLGLEPQSEGVYRCKLAHPGVKRSRGHWCGNAPRYNNSWTPLPGETTYFDLTRWREILSHCLWPTGNAPTDSEENQLVPSWSWAAAGGPVKWFAKEGEKQNFAQDMKVLKVEVPKDSKGRISGIPYVEVRGFVRDEDLHKDRNLTITHTDYATSLLQRGSWFIDLDDPLETRTGPCSILRAASRAPAAGLYNGPSRKEITFLILRKCDKGNQAEDIAIYRRIGLITFAQGGEGAAWEHLDQIFHPGFSEQVLRIV